MMLCASCRRRLAPRHHVLSWRCAVVRLGACGFFRGRSEATSDQAYFGRLNEQPFSWLIGGTEDDRDREYR
jgi:hypothetical protein